MSAFPHEATSAAEQPLANLLFDYPGADIVLCSQDSYHFRVPKTTIVHNSPVLGELIRATLDSFSDVNAETSPPVVQLPEGHKILHCLLTFIFLVTPFLPSTPEEIMELLSVAQKYQMGDALTHIRGSIARQNLLPTGLEPALHIYVLAQKYGLLPEALQAARKILNHPMTIEDFHSKLDIMPGPSLFELWKYYEKVRAILASDLTEFRKSRANGTITGSCRTGLSSYQTPSWLDRFIESIGQAPNLFDLVEFNTAMVYHLRNGNGKELCECASILGQTIRKFWEALTSVVHGSFENAESALSLVGEREDSQAKVSTFTSPPKPFDVPDANFIIQSSDNINFRVHKSVLALASPFFTNLLSLPQPSDTGTVDGLPVIQLSESSELLNSLISILYPVPTVMPNSYEKVLYLLAACQKYEMVSVQSFIRAEVSRGASPAPEGVEVFAAYAIASANGLIPEMENAAHLTLSHPMTFKILGERLQLFEGCALRDLASFRKRCRDNLIMCLNSFLELQPPGPSSIWIGCPKVMPNGPSGDWALPKWLKQILSRNQKELKLQKFTHTLDIHSRIRQEYFTALQSHSNCNFCSGTHIKNGSTFCAELENKLAQALDKEWVRPSDDLDVQVARDPVAA